MEPTPSWVTAANAPGAEFPLDNLPCAVTVIEGRAEPVMGLGDRLIRLRVLDGAGLLPPALRGRFDAPVWNRVMAAGPSAWHALRARLTALLAEGGEDALRARPDIAEAALPPMAGADFALPVAVAEFTDFYAGRHHALNVGTMLRGADAALPPQWDWMPMGYNGRASSVVISGTPVPRPRGQIMPEDADTPIFAPTRRLDFELELGAVIGQGCEGPVTVAEAEEMIFGYVLLNDWSARDIQAWEYRPLGPFLAKATATTVGPWIVMAGALAPFRVAGPAPVHPPLAHLAEPHVMKHDIALEAALAPEGAAETTITRTNAAELSWSFPQQIAHHASGNCPMRVGDLIGSGTISGAAPEARGSMLELSRGGREPVRLRDGHERSFLEDGDEVILSGRARRGTLTIGFGRCRGRLLPARPLPGGARPR